MKFNKSVLIKNTIIVLVTGFIVKAIGMLGKILSTRMLGVTGMELYVLSYPTILLFINITGFSLNQSVSKLVSEAIATKKYSPKIIIKKAVKISLIISLFACIIYLSLLNIFCNNLLKNRNLFFPLLCGVILLPLTGISDALRGYYNGLKQMRKASTSLLFEQLFRTMSALTLIFLLKPYGIIIASSGLVISLSIGEIASIIYCLIKMKKEDIIHYHNTKNETKAIINMSLPVTGGRLIGSATFFLEPILYLFILNKIGYSTRLLQSTYTTIDAFIIPLITFFAFLPFALTTAILPHLSESYAIKDEKQFNNYLNKSINFTFTAALFSSLIMMFFGQKFMLLFFNVTVGGEEVEKYAIFFILYYFNPLFACTMQAIGKVKRLFIISTTFNILRIILIVTLSFIPSIGPYSIIYASFISINLEFITFLFNVLKSTSFSLQKKQIINFTLTICFSIAYFKFMTLFPINYLLICFIYFMLLLLIYLKIINR